MTVDNNDVRGGARLNLASKAEALYTEGISETVINCTAGGRRTHAGLLFATGGADCRLGSVLVGLQHGRLPQRYSRGLSQR